VWKSQSRAARLLLCRLAWTPSRLDTGELCLFTGVSAPFPGVMIYFRWLTFLLDLTGLSRASLMLLEAESMKLRRSLVVSLKSSSCSASPAASPVASSGTSEVPSDHGFVPLMKTLGPEAARRHCRAEVTGSEESG
uniref:Uncharacterized protein n=1 Tax=Oryzias sinensis TaxID=183150 RepID=A0A8C8A373_9TELE